MFNKTKCVDQRVQQVSSSKTYRRKGFFLSFAASEPEGRAEVLRRAPEADSVVTIDCNTIQRVVVNLA